MENKELFTKKIEGKVVDIELGEHDDMTIKLEGDKTIKFESLHDQDCCEHVYADFSVMKYYKEQLVEKTLSDMVIKGVDKMGFLLCFNINSYNSVKVFVPCYNEQNGYYSDSFSLKVDEVTIDMEGFVEDRVF